jgi:hypothetical protein
LSDSDVPIAPALKRTRQSSNKSQGSTGKQTGTSSIQVEIQKNASPAKKPGPARKDSGALQAVQGNVSKKASQSSVSEVTRDAISLKPGSTEGLVSKQANHPSLTPQTIQGNKNFATQLLNENQVSDQFVPLKSGMSFD